MKIPGFLGVLLLGGLLVGCITEPAPEEPTVYGYVANPKKVKEKPLPKPKPVVEEVDERPVWH